MEPIGVLQEDYRTTLAFIDKCDGHMFQVKNWAIISTSAVVAFAFSRDKPIIILANLILIVAFLYLELTYKAFQDSVIKHADDLATRIDKYLGGMDGVELIAGFEYGFGRKIKYPTYKAIVKLVDSKHWYVIKFYIIIAVLSVGAYGLCLSVA